MCNNECHLPCLHCQPDSYIRMVHHLIERCLLFQMSRDECIKALVEHADVQPLVTLTVWKELRKENEGFFRAYHHAISPRRPRFSYKPIKRALKNRRRSKQQWRRVNKKSASFL